MPKLCCPKREGKPSFEKDCLFLEGRKFLEQTPLIYLSPLISPSGTIAKRCRVTHVGAVLPKANTPSYASLIAQPPRAAPKPTFSAFRGWHSLPRSLSTFLQEEMTALAPALLPPLVRVQEKLSQKAAWGETFACTRARAVGRLPRPSAEHSSGGRVTF